LFLSKKELVGLDIGSNAVKLVELKSSKNGYQLKNIGEAILPHHSIVNKIIEKRDAVADTISSLFEDLRVRTRNVAISISGHSVIIKKVSLPMKTSASTPTWPNASRTNLGRTSIYATSALNAPVAAR